MKKKITTMETITVSGEEVSKLKEWLYYWKNNRRILLSPHAGKTVEWHYTDDKGYFYTSKNAYDNPIDAISDAIKHIKTNEQD